MRCLDDHVVAVRSRTALVAIFGAKQQPRAKIAPDRDGDAIGGLYPVGAPQPAHEPCRHTGPSNAAMVLPSPSEFSSSCR
jgi:hypothetical protein